MSTWESVRFALRKKHRVASDGAMDAIRKSLWNDYYNDPTGAGEYLSTPEGKKDLLDHLEGRLASDREIIVPWLEDIQPLNGAAILEIGCGTGSSTVAMAEQGADVIGLDIHTGALKVARTRCAAYRVDCHLSEADAATEAMNLLQQRRFDFVIFFASLEHMTIDERLRSLQSTWDALAPGSHLVVIETPNRLWYFDHHTAWTNFFNWLPDELAFRYLERTPRVGLHQLSRQVNELLPFLRWGRGVSFHEFELAFNRSVADITVSSCLSLYAKGNGDDEDSGGLDARYERLLAEIHPQAHRGFLLPQLNLAFTKPARSG